MNLTDRQKLQVIESFKRFYDELKSKKLLTQDIKIYIDVKYSHRDTSFPYVIISWYNSDIKGLGFNFNELLQKATTDLKNKTSNFYINYILDILNNKEKIRKEIKEIEKTSLKELEDIINL